MSAKGPLPRRSEPLVFELSSPGKRGQDLPHAAVPEVDVKAALGPHYREDTPGLPEVSEPEVVRHFTRLSQMNYSVDTGLYPLGSCTMKYNPKINEELCRIPAFLESHPYQPEVLSQGNLEILKRLEELLCEITGMAGFTLQPAAGAHGELTGLMILRAALTDRGDPRKVVLVPDSAHGTNPSSAAICGYRVETLESCARGMLDVEAVRRRMADDVAALMLTNPNTLGIFEEDIAEICEIVHERGGLVYMDGANLNAIVGMVRPASTGVDVMHLNLHKTFSTPHGGGGPGSGPVGVVESLVPFLPVPRILRDGANLRLSHDAPKSIGRVRAFYGNFGMALRGLAYILSQGASGLLGIAENAVLNANYIRARLKDVYHLPFETPSLHEVIFSHRNQKRNEVTALDIAKRLMDHGFHPPTIFFPLVVDGALMIEPTETESIQELDAFVDAMRAIAREAEEDPETLRHAPYSTPVRRLDETRAARQPKLRWKPGAS